MRPVSDGLHIGLVISNLAGGGAERVILTLADTLIKRGHRVDLVMEEFTGDYRSGIPQGLRLYSPMTPELERGAAGLLPGARH